MIKYLGMMGLLVLMGVLAQTQSLVEEVPRSADMEKWWQEVQACSGLKGDIDRLKFFVVNDSIILLKGRVYHAGAADVETHSLYFTRGNERSPFVVKHEMLHDLIGHGGHPVIPFATPCNLYRIDGEPNLKARAQ